MALLELNTTYPSWLPVVTAVLSLFIFFRYVSTLKESQKLPPSPPKLPLIGNLHQLLAKHRHQTLWRLSQKLGPIMLLHVGHKPLLIISSSDLAKQVLKTHDLKLCGRTLSKGTKRITYNYLDVAFSPHGNHQMQMRKILVSEFFGSKRARAFNQVMEMEIERAVHSLSLLPSNTLVNLDEKFLALISGVVGKVGFGKSYREDLCTSGKLREMLDGAMDMFGGFSFGDYFPTFGGILDELNGRNASLKKFFSDIDGFVQRVLDEHLDQAVPSSDHEKDFAEVLVELSSKENSSYSRLAKQEMKALLMDVLTGSIDTTVVTMVWAMAETVNNSRVMNKLQAEIRTCVGRKDKVDASDIAKMTYLKMVVKETLRLHPPAPLLIPHECLQPCQIGGYDVFPGTSIIINAWGIGRDPSIWKENPDEFYPERFESVEFDFGGNHFEMVPFGGGRRICPGLQLALWNTEYTIANFLYWFDWQVPVEVKNEVLCMEEEDSLVVHKKSPVCLVPQKHNWQD